MMYIKELQNQKDKRVQNFGKNIFINALINQKQNIGTKQKYKAEQILICICGSYMKRLYKLSFIYLPTGEYVQELSHYHQSPQNLSIKYKTQQHKDM